MRLGTRAVATFFMAAAFCPPGTQACERPDRGTCAALAQIEVVDRNTGETLPIYWHDGQRWIAGTPGHRYSVGLRNSSAGRILGIVSIDGLNAISGETASWSQAGYVLGPRQGFEVLGWRKSLDHVADFVFSSVANSYAARTGRPDNVGVIGVALFREAVPLPPVSMLHDRRSEDAGAVEHSQDAAADSAQAPKAASPGGATAAAAAGSAANTADSASARGSAAAGQAQAQAVARAQLREQRLGTGHGPAESSVVATTTFTPAQAQPDEIVSIRYDARERLVAMGILAPLQPPAPDRQPFPGSAHAGFVADPPIGMR